MPKLTKSNVKTAFSAQKTIPEILKITRVQKIEELEEFVNKEFTGALLKLYQERIDEYKKSNPDTSVPVMSPEEEYENVQKYLEEKRQERAFISQKIEETKKSLSDLESKYSRLNNEIGSLTDKLKKLEKELTIRIAFSTNDSKFEKPPFAKTIEEIDFMFEESAIGDLIARIHTKIPKNMEFSDVILLIKTIIFINSSVEKNKKIHLYVSEDVKAIFEEYTTLDITEIN